MRSLTNLPDLTRTTTDAGAPAPVRMVHLGLGAFHRSHQAWYTAAADPDHEWGIAAFTGRSPDAAEVLAAQDGLYTLVERDDAGDRFEVVGSISAAHHGGDVGELARLIASPGTAVVTLTITEPAYHLGSDGLLDSASSVVAQDLEVLRSWQQARTGAASGTPLDPPGQLATAGARLVVGFDARRHAGGGPLAVVSCDNLSSNGTAAAETILGFARPISEELAVWITDNVSFVDSSIDRITPRTTEADVDLVAEATGFRDLAPVVTEPFHNWILSGAFPAGRPAWERAGAVFTERIEPFEQRKLWLLNGAHSLLAYAGQLRGHETVADAVADTRCAAWLEDFWDEASHHLTEPGLDVPGYRAALQERFSNSRIRHQLSQIAAEGSSKLRMRAVPVLLAERKAGRTGRASARIIAAWIDQLLADGAARKPVADAAAGTIERILAGDPDDVTAGLVRFLDDRLDDDVVALVHSLRTSWRA
ncbi:mannitol dehydrogenase family protein [Arthrobacter burdickii]|uniref:mannitol dehydrogenase family protein n=1 Tax=Arthrobacter burdickii TaxID=3035920 RepID=UPI003F4E1B42